MYTIRTPCIGRRLPWARHAYGDIYKDTEFRVPCPGKAEIRFTDAEGNVLFENRYSRPEVTSFVFGKKLPKEGLTCTCTLTDIYGRSKTFEWKDGE